MSLMRQKSGTLIENWYAACTSKELKSKPISRVIFETRVVLWRDRTGQAFALRDRCLHRNALLSPGEKSKCGSKITCPYHGWEFDHTGQCTSVPSEGPDGKPYAGGAVEAFPIKEQEGLIWLWMGQEKKPTKDPFPMPFYATKGWQTYFMITDFDNNVTNLVENFMDVPHTVFVHKGWFRDRVSHPVPSTVERQDEAVIVEYFQNNDGIGFTDRIINPKKLPMVHTDKFYMPNNTRVDYIYGENERGFVITSTCTPASEMKTRVFTCISYNLGILQSTAWMWLPWYTRQVIQQDVVIMANQGQALQEEEAEFKSTPADLLHLYIESLREAAQDNRPAPKPIKKEMTFWI